MDADQDSRPCPAVVCREAPDTIRASVGCDCRTSISSGQQVARNRAFQYTFLPGLSGRNIGQRSYSIRVVRQHWSYVQISRLNSWLSFIDSNLHVYL